MNAPLLMGMIALAVAICHEVFWWKRRNWNRLPGTVVEICTLTKRNRTSHHPVISYTLKEETRQFTAKHGGNTHPKVGESVTVIVSPDGDTEEHYSRSNRWFISAIASCMGLLLIVKGIMDLQG